MKAQGSSTLVPFWALFAFLRKRRIFQENSFPSPFSVSRFISLCKISAKTNEQTLRKTGKIWMNVYKRTYFYLRQQLLGWEYYHWAGVAFIRGNEHMMLRRAYAFYEYYVISRGEAMFEKGVKILEDTKILKCLNTNCRFWLIKTVLFTRTFALTLNFQIKVVSTFFYCWPSFS